jgi:hypothetical protein
MPERPSFERPQWALYQNHVGPDMRQDGFTDPEGTWYAFGNGEELAHMQNDEGGRDTYVKLADGTLVPVNTWKAGS